MKNRNKPKSNSEIKISAETTDVSYQLYIAMDNYMSLKPLYYIFIYRKKLMFLHCILT